MESNHHLLVRSKVSYPLKEQGIYYVKARSLTGLSASRLTSKVLSLPTLCTRRYSTPSINSGLRRSAVQQTNRSLLKIFSNVTDFIVYSLLVLSGRIELPILSYQDRGIPLTYKSLVGLNRIELLSKPCRGFVLPLN